MGRFCSSCSCAVPALPGATSTRCKPGVLASLQAVSYTHLDVYKRQLGLVAMLGLGSIVGAWLLPGVALSFVGGVEYAEMGPRLWVFAALGTALSMLQLLVYAVLARRGTRSSWLLWVAFAAVVLVGRTASTPMELAMIVLAADIVVLAVLFGLSMALIRKPIPVEPDTTALPGHLDA